MKISVLLPYKENFAEEYAGAVSIFINSTNAKSIYKNDITVYGYTEYNKILSKRYCNLSLKNKSIIQSNSDFYVNNFIKKKSVINSEIIEIHNRPNYIKKILLLKNVKKVLYFHNNPLEMKGSSTINESVKSSNSGFSPTTGTSTKGVDISVLGTEMPGILQDVVKYSTFGS